VVFATAWITPQVLCESSKEAMTTEDDPDQMLTVKEAATLLRVNVKTVYAEIAAGHLAFAKVGRLIRIPRHVLTSIVKQARVCR
jgi:excisionase family DNA binding protein